MSEENKPTFTSRMRIDKGKRIVSGGLARPIYPKLNMRLNEILNFIEAETYLRKKHTDGKWYLQLFYQKRTIELNDLKIKDAIINLHSRISFEVYTVLTCGIIDLNIKDSFANDVFILDENQESEEDRIKKLGSISI